MKRSIGVTVIAVLSLLGSLFMLLMAALMAAMPFFLPKLPNDNTALPPGFFKSMMLISAIVYTLPAIWGIVTSIGLFRLKEWARISIIVFTVLLILTSGFGGLMAVLVPMPTPPNQPTDANVTAGVRVFMAVFAGTMVTIGVWWLVFFTRPKVKQQFVPARALVTDPPLAPPDSIASFSEPTSTPPVPQQPLSLTILAWLMLVGAVFIPFNIWLRVPGVFLLWVVSGWPAIAYFVVFGLAHLYVGVGLIRLKLMARSVGVAYYVFVFVNMVVFYVAPGARSRILDLHQKAQASMWWIPRAPAQTWSQDWVLSTPFRVLTVSFGLIWILVPLYFLVTRKDAFEKAAAAVRDGFAPSSPS
jgi:hypothetical protein